MQLPSGRDGMVERKIAEAQSAGLFDDLIHAGKPIELRQNPHSDPTWRLAYHVLENAGLAPAWIEERRSLQEALNQMRQAHKNQQQSDFQPGNAERIKYIEAINKRIDTFNLTVPNPAFRLGRIPPEGKLGRDT